MLLCNLPRPPSRPEVAKAAAGTTEWFIYLGVEVRYLYSDDYDFKNKAMMLGRSIVRGALKNV